MRNTSLLFCLLLICFSVSAQKKEKHPYKISKGGIPYKFTEDKKGKPAGVCDYVEFHIHSLYHDSIMFDSRLINDNDPIQFQLEEPTFSSDLTNAFLLMSPGDSAEFLLSIDSISKHTGQVSTLFAKGDTLVYRIRLISVKSPEQVSKEMAEKKKARVDNDEKLILDYLSANNLKATRARSGIYYVMLKEGEGDTIRAGQNVSVNYTGKTLDNQVFDSNVDPSFHHEEPLSFMVGNHQVIPGWDKSVEFLRMGSKAIVFIPSYLAYGETSPGPGIPKNAILIFEMEIVGVE